MAARTTAERGAMLRRIIWKCGRRWSPAYQAIIEKYPKLNHVQRINHLGTLGTGNHFIEVCLDENENGWFLLHSGSRGVGNRFGTFFIELAKNDMRQWM
jgi:tRNA-splicing ligase RtcB